MIFIAVWGRTLPTSSCFLVPSRAEQLQASPLYKRLLEFERLLNERQSRPGFIGLGSSPEVSTLGGEKSFFRRRHLGS